MRTRRGPSWDSPAPRSAAHRRRGLREVLAFRPGGGLWQVCPPLSKIIRRPKRYSRRACPSTAEPFIYKAISRLIVNSWYCSIYSISAQEGCRASRVCARGIFFKYPLDKLCFSPSLSIGVIAEPRNTRNTRKGIRLLFFAQGFKNSQRTLHIKLKTDIRYTIL